MPIVFVHGVAVRNSAAWDDIRTYLRRYIAPVISSLPAQVTIEQAYWGDIGVRFAWNGASRPRTPIARQGAATGASTLDQALALFSASDEIVRAGGVVSDSSSKLASMGPAGTTRRRPPLDLSSLQPDELTDLFSEAIVSDPAAATEDRARLLVALDEVAHDGTTIDELGRLRDSDEQFRFLLQQWQKQLSTTARVAGMGAPVWLAKAMDRVRETTSRADELPAFVLARGLAEFRRPLNERITLFLGDVFVYLRSRALPNGKPGPIPALVVDVLRNARNTAPPAEPLVVVSHSMGGQIVYDLVTTFIPAARAAGEDVPRIDFWCATASQVGLFEEMKLFLASKDTIAHGTTPSKVPFPDRDVLGGWWNVWDHTDFISFSAREIFEDVEDESFSAGQFQAHSGYLARPSFYRRMAERVTVAKQSNWGRP
jgi:hypothetical protein